MSDLIVNNTLEVTTDYGLRQIQLCVGSVTKSKDPVDVLVVSAFPGDYTPTETSVIGALKYDLRISVRQMAKEKEEDLRKFFSCWWSKPLDGNFPFKQILCFEGGFKRNMRPPSTVGEVFRCLVSLCKDKEISVMMPLLSTGDQNYSREMMLRLIVEATVHWMKTGLPLKTLKIVVHQKDAIKLSPRSTLLSNYFQTLKEAFLDLEEQSKLQQKTEFKYDFYLSYSPNNVHSAKVFIEHLLKENPEYRIHSEQQVINSEKSWQDEMYEVIITCRRVVVLLSPDFLQNTSCVEQYNIALCCSRNMGHQYLFPIYIHEVTQMPTYMGLIQYIECRPVTNENVKTTCEQLTFDQQSSTNLQDPSKEKSIFLGKQYDLFISYSHKDMEIANMIYSFLCKQIPHWNIFIDRQVLKAGSAWQTKLYSSIENSRAVLALMSYNYLDSKVCQEEFNLARALCEDPKYTCTLVEVKLEEVSEWPVWCTPSHWFDFTETKRNGTTMLLMFEQLMEEREFFSPIQVYDVVLSIDEITSISRQNFAKLNFPITADTKFTSKAIFQSYEHQPSESYDVILSFHESDRRISEMLSSQLQTCVPHLNIFLPTNAKESSILHVLDQGKLVIPLLSESYVTTPSLMEEFNTVLCRHRFCKGIVMFPIVIGKLPRFPAFPLLTFCFFSTEDAVWESFHDGVNKVESCINTASVVVANILIRRPMFENSFKTLFSMRELEHWNCALAREETTAISPLLFTTSVSSHQVTIATLSDTNNSLLTVDRIDTIEKGTLNSKNSSSSDNASPSSEKQVPSTTTFSHRVDVVTNT